MYRHHSKTEKKKAISLYEAGFGSTSIGNKLDIADRIIRRWIKRYRELGEQSFERHSYTIVTTDFKRMIVVEVLAKCLSCEQVAMQYKISESAVYSWVQRVKNNGYASLSDVKPRGRPPKDMGRPKKREPQTELEKLRERVAYLETENALLKKVRALVEERIARESGKKPKPSKH